MPTPPQAWDPRADIAEVLFDAAAIGSKVQELAAVITADYLPRWQEDPSWSLLLVSVLRGAIFFVTDLSRALGIPTTVDFMAIATYGRAHAGKVRILKDLEDDIQGRDVLVVEDIIDTGLSLRYLIRSLGARGPRSLNVVTLIDRPGLRIAQDLPVRYVGFELGETFVVGYGLDYQERYRDLPFIGVLKPEVTANGR